MFAGAAGWLRSKNAVSCRVFRWCLAFAHSLQCLEGEVINNHGAGQKADEKIIEHFLQGQADAGILFAIAPKAAQCYQIKGNGNDYHRPHAAR